MSEIENMTFRAVCDAVKVLERIEKQLDLIQQSQESIKEQIQKTNKGE